MKQKQKEKRVWHRFVSILSCVVVFCTTYALILPAVTMERDDIVYYCEKEEHQHTDECYESSEPLCGLEESESANHAHDENCYEEQEVLDCVEEHEHTQECYKTESVLICYKEEEKAHQHSAKCYLSADPLCGQEVHTHSRECESNKELKETKEDWEKSIPTTLKEKTSERMVQIALSQKDYKEVKENFEIDEDGHEHYYTRYGEWYGKPYEDWNVMFISFVLKYAGIKNEQIPYGHDWNEWIEDLTKKQLLAPEDYEPKDGDLIFIKDLPDENIPDKEIKNYAGIITVAKNKKVVIGDLNGQVKEITLDDKEYETNAYVEIKNEEQNKEEDPKPEEDQGNIDNDINEEQPAEEEPVEEEQETIDYQLPENFTIENEDFTLVLTPRVFNDEEDQEETNTEETENEGEEQGLRIKQFSLSENIQEKIDEESQLTKEELEQIEQEKEQEKKEEEEKPVLTVQLEKIDEQTETNEEEQAEIEQLREQSLENVEQENLLDLSFYKLRFFANDQEVDLGAQKFDAELTPSKEFVEKFDVENEFPDAAPEAEVGYYLQVVQPGVQVPSALSNHIVTKEATIEQMATSSLTSTTNTNSLLINEEYKGDSMIMTLNADEPLGTITNKTPNPEFKVQIYGKLLKNKVAPDEVYNLTPAERQGQTFQVIDMSDGIPNSYADAKFKDYVKGADGGFVLETSNTPEILYSSTPYRYHQAPHLKYFNKLEGIDSYSLKQIWVLKDGKTEESVEDEDWVVFDENEINSIHYTNSTEGKTKDPDNEVLYRDSSDNKYILINNYDPNKSDNNVQETVIRLIFEEVNQKKNVDSPTKFWDYDFFDDNNIIRKNNENTGINNKSNYTNGDIKFVFGNKVIAQELSPAVHELQYRNQYINRGTEMYNLMLNMYDEDNNVIRTVNRGTSAAPAFNLVQNSLTSDGKIQYNVTAPLLFTVGTAKGKSAELGAQLSFHRIGDTHRLYSVTGPGPNGTTEGGKTISNLDKFVTRPNWNKTFNFQANDYWPLDNYNKSKNYGSNKNDKFRIESGSTIKEVGKSTSDDGGDHNTAFGMRYDVNFDLDEYYKGPLRYFFFGDDDMWVFIDGKLVCDLGGVHQTIGAEVDIREAYKVSTGHDLGTGEHKMTVYYLERGQSGSTCYLEYTLPKVSFDIPESKTGELQIQKETNNPDPEKDYLFEIEFKDADGNELPDDYALTVYSKVEQEDGSIKEVIDENRSNVTVHSKGQILLKNHQYATVKYLPLGTQYTVTEILSDEDSKKHTLVSYRDASAGTYIDFNKNSIGRYAVSGIIQGQGTISYAHYFNKIAYQLPETGSLGIDPPFIAGSASVVTTSFYALTIQRKKRRKKK